MEGNVRNEHVSEPLRSALEAAFWVDGAAIRYELLPEDYRGVMRRYIENRLDPGTGWQLILAHDLAAVCYCDDSLAHNAPLIFRWLHNHAPSACHGSKEKIEEWLR
jgi:hypothetical protein